MYGSTSTGLRNVVPPGLKSKSCVIAAVAVKVNLVLNFLHSASNFLYSSEKALLINNTASSEEHALNPKVYVDFTSEVQAVRNRFCAATDLVP